MSRLKKSAVKRAAISIEISLSLVLSVAILIFVLSLFSTNIEKMAQASGLYNYFFHKNEVAKTYQTDTKNAEKTQVEVQLVADQGLNYYKDKALATIEQYKENPPTTQSQIEDLAKAAAVAKMYGELSNDDKNLFSNDYFINISYDSALHENYVSVNNQKITYDISTFANTNDYYKIAKLIYNSDFD